MSQPAENLRRYTIAEYLALENRATDRHEFHDGEILVMSGNSFAHVQISTSLIIALGTRLRGTSCQPLESNMRVRVPRRNRYVYPDVSVICGQPEFDAHSEVPVNLLNPRVVFEVLSDSTAEYDRGDKFDGYRTIDSLEEYVLIAQTQASVLTFHRQPDGSWRMDSYDSLDAVVKLRSLGIEIPATEIYLNVVFPPPVPPVIS